MPTTPIRFLLVQESLKDRTLFSILRNEGHEVGFLLPGDSDLSRYPVPEDTPIMTTPKMVDSFNPAVYMFPRPYVGKYAGEQIRNKKFVVGSSQSHHALASTDQGYAEAILKNSDLPYTPSLYAATEAEFNHYLTFLESQKKEPGTRFRFSPSPLVHIDCDTPQQLGHISWTTGVRSNCSISQYNSEDPSWMHRTVCFLGGGKQLLPPAFDVSVRDGMCSLVEATTYPVVEEIRRKLEHSIVAIRYTGPLFVSYICDRRGLEVIQVTELTSEVPNGFWAALYFAVQYRDGLGKALLHMGRHTLLQCPVRSPGISVMAERCTLESEYFDREFELPIGSKLSPEYCIEQGFVAEDVIGGKIQGPQLGWVCSGVDGGLAPKYFDSWNYSRRQLNIVVESAAQTCYSDEKIPPPTPILMEDKPNEEIPQRTGDGGDPEVLPDSSGESADSSGDSGHDERNQTTGSEEGPTAPSSQCVTSGSGRSGSEHHGEGEEGS